jgi:hypothetical protein
MGAEMACVALIRGLGSATLVAGDKHLGDKRAWTPKREERRVDVRVESKRERRRRRLIKK